MLIFVDNFILWGQILYWLLETVYYYAQVTVHNWHNWLETRQICSFAFLHAQLSQEFPIWMLEYFGGSPGFEFRCHTCAMWNNIWKKNTCWKKRCLNDEKSKSRFGFKYVLFSPRSLGRFFAIMFQIRASTTNETPPRRGRHFNLPLTIDECVWPDCFF